MTTPLTTAQFLTIADAIAAHYDEAGAALDRGRAKVDALSARVLAAGDLNHMLIFAAKLAGLQDKASAASWFGGQYRDVVRALTNDISNYPPAAGIISVDSFATYNNALTPYSCLLPPEFAQVYYQAEGLQLTPGNVFCPGGPSGPAAVPPGANTAGVANPAAAPTVAASAAGGSLTTGNYDVVYTWVTPDGETQASAVTTTAVVGPTGRLTVAALALPAGVTAAKLYVSDAAGSATRRLAAAPRVTVEGTADATDVTAVPLSEYAFHTAAGNVVVAQRGYPMARGLITGVDATTYAALNGGVIPAANNTATVPVTQGYSAAELELVALQAFTGAGDAQLTFAGTNQAGVVKNFVALVVVAGVGLAQGAALTLVPQTGGDRARSVTGVAKTGSGSITAGEWRLRVKQSRVVT